MQNQLVETNQLRRDDQSNCFFFQQKNKRALTRGIDHLRLKARPAG